MRIRKVERPKGKWWDEVTFWRFVNALRASGDESAAARMLPIVLTTTGTGLRLGEVCGLRWEDVDLTRRVLVVRQQAQQVGQVVTYVKPKTRRGEDRVVPLTAWVPDVLESRRKQQIAERLAFGPDYTETSLVFTSEDGRPLLPASISKAFTRLVRAEDMPPCRFHDLRHIAATVLLRAGVAMPVVSRILGHASISTTVDTYGHVEVDPQVHEAMSLAFDRFARPAQLS